MADREFRAKYSAPCKVCGLDVKGRLATWTRSATKKGYVHLECWRAQQQAGTTTNGTNASIETQKEETETMQTNQTGDSAVLNLLGDALWTRFESRVKTVESNSDKLESVISDLRSELTSKLDSILTPTVIKIETTTVDGVKTQDLGVQHHMFPVLLKMLQAKDHRGNKLNIWIAGPAGTGKTSAAEQAAKALDLPITILGTLTESYRFFGYMAPGTGQYVKTPARDVWENGGILLLDDFDGSDPNCVIELNSAFANGLCTFPDATVPRHKDCAIVLTANTWGQGATNDYVGRLKQDGAAIDRFVKLYWDTDEALELATAPNQSWTKRVQQVRAAVQAKGIKTLVTPRASYHGAALLAAGLSWEETEQAVLKGTMTNDQWESVC